MEGNLPVGSQVHSVISADAYEAMSERAGKAAIGFAIVTTIATVALGMIAHGFHVHNLHTHLAGALKAVAWSVGVSGGAAALAATVAAAHFQGKATETAAEGAVAAEETFEQTRLAEFKENLRQLFANVDKPHELGPPLPPGQGPLWKMHNLKTLLENTESLNIDMIEHAYTHLQALSEEMRQVGDNDYLSDFNREATLVKGLALDGLKACDPSDQRTRLEQHLKQLL